MKAEDIINLSDEMKTKIVLYMAICFREGNDFDGWDFETAMTIPLEEVIKELKLLEEETL